MADEKDEFSFDTDFDTDWDDKAEPAVIPDVEVAKEKTSDPAVITSPVPPQSPEAVKSSPVEKAEAYSRPEFRGGMVPPEYQSVLDRINAQYAFLPDLNFDDIYKELAELNVKSSPTPTLQVVNDEIQKVQAAKDRLSEIFIDVYKCYTFKNRVVDLMVESWARFSEEKSADKRKADCAFRLSNYSIDLATTEALLKSCTNILKNLDSAHEALSRRITVWQLTLKIGDIGRGALPDHDLSGSQYGYGRSRTEVDSTVGIEAQEKSF